MAFLRFALLLALVLFPSRLLAQTTQPQGLQDYAVTTWNENDGLSATRIMALEQDKVGYLWLGTDAGLVRFDGVHFEPITEVDKTKLPVAPTSALLGADDGSLWFGVISTVGVMRLQGNTLTVFGPKQGLTGGYAMVIVEDRSHAIWVGNSAGLFRFDGERFRAVTGQPGLIDTPVLAVLESRDGGIWAASRAAVYRRDREGEPFRQVDTIGISSNVWTWLSEAQDGTVWIGDLDHGFRQVGLDTSKAGVSTHPDKGWGAQLLHDRRGNMWVATRGDGLWRVREAETGHPKIDILSLGQGVASDAVQCLLEDRDGNIWVGTYAGLQRLTPHRVKPVFDVPIVRATASTRDGSVWVGGTNGLTRYMASGHRRHYDEQPGLSSRLVLALYADNDGVLWIATARGLTRFMDEAFKPVFDLPVEAGSQPMAPADRPAESISRIFSIARTRSGLWLRDVNLKLVRATERGAVQEALEVRADFRQNVVSLASDRRDNLWIGALNGRLGVLRPDGAFQSYQLGIGNIRTIYESKDGTIWVGGDDGLSTIAGDRTHTLTTAQGLPKHVKSIAEDDDGVLWVGVGVAIARIERSEIVKAQADSEYQLAYRLFNTADGTAGVPVNDGSTTVARAPGGRLYFATSAGVTVVDPQTIGEPRAETAVVLERISADTSHLKPNEGATLPAASSYVFSYRALTLTDSTRALFKYRLDGIDSDWVDAGVSREAAYRKLGPGPYVFRVMASNADGVWGTPKELRFHIAPAFFQTWLFYGLCGIGAAALVVALWHLHAWRARRRFALVLAERIRMSRAIHDTLLQGLAGLALQLDDLAHDTVSSQQATSERLRRIRRRVEEYIREARQSIWDLRSSVLERRSFPDALREVGSRAIAERPVAFDVSVIGNPKTCSPVVEQQLLLICQEALTNAVRHGQPSNVDVELEYVGNSVRVSVTDDGRGFDPATLENVNGHYGVVSMRERAAQVRGTLTIASAPGKGTQVETVVPA